MAQAPMAPPSAKDPVSPINTWAGWKLKNRKPASAPIKAMLKNVTDVGPPLYNVIIAKNPNTKREEPPHRPSRPSVRFTAFVMANCRNTVKGM